MAGGGDGGEGGRGGWGVRERDKKRANWGVGGGTVTEPCAEINRVQPPNPL